MQDIDEEDTMTTIVIYAAGAIALALTYAGHTWGLGRWWARLPVVQKHRWLI